MNCPQISEITYKKFSDKLHGKVVSERIPIDGTIELTMRCNLNCSHCYCAHDKSKVELSTSQWKNVLDQITEAGCLWLLITGGEPLLRDDFAEIYLYAKKKGLIVSLFTNGTLIDKKILDLLVENPPFVVEITLYGATDETYEKVCKRKNVLNSVLNNIEQIKQRKIPLKLKSTITKHNVRELPQLKKIAECYSADFRFDGLIFPKIDGDMMPLNERIDSKTLAGLEIKQSSAIWTQIYNELKIDLNTQSSALQCQAGKTTFQINSYGYLFMCTMLNGLFFDLKENGFQKGWDRFEEILKGFPKVNKDCIKCDSFPICDICPGLAYLENNNYTKSSKYLCDLAKQRKETILT